jgi:hypothetical protein
LKKKISRTSTIGAGTNENKWWDFPLAANSKRQSYNRISTFCGNKYRIYKGKSNEAMRGIVSISLFLQIRRRGGSFNI